MPLPPLFPTGPRAPWRRGLRREPLCRPPLPDAEPVLRPWRPPRPRHARQDQQHGGARRSVPAARLETPPSSRPWECAWFELNRWESSRCRAERTPRIGGSTLRFNRLADRARRADPLRAREHRSSRTSWSRPLSCCSKPNRRCRTPLRPASPAFILQAPPWDRSRRRSALPEALRGMAATNSTRRGSLNEARMGFR